ALAGAGYRVEVVDLRPPRPRLEPDGAYLDGLAGEARRFADAVLGTTHGQVVLRHPREFAACADLLERLYPLARVAVAVPTRRAVWHNAARNAAVAGLALELALDPGAALARLGAGGREGERPGRAGRARVAVLVESTEHGRALLALLPGWRLLHAAAGAGGAEG